MLKWMFIKITFTNALVIATVVAFFVAQANIAHAQIAAPISTSNGANPSSIAPVPNQGTNASTPVSSVGLRKSGDNPRQIVTQMKEIDLPETAWKALELQGGGNQQTLFVLLQQPAMSKWTVMSPTVTLTDKTKAAINITATVPLTEQPGSI
jgi:hypothetical protein